MRKYSRFETHREQLFWLPRPGIQYQNIHGPHFHNPVIVLGSNPRETQILRHISTDFPSSCIIKGGQQVN